MAYTEQDFSNTARPLAQALIIHAMTAGRKFGITDAKVSISLRDSQKNSVEKGVVSESSGGISCNVSITLYAGDRVLNFTQNTFDPGALKAAIDKNAEAIGLVPPNPNKRLLEPSKVFKGKAADLGLYDETPASTEELIDFAKKAEAAALALDGVNKTRATQIEKKDFFLLMLATNGLDICEKSTTYSASILAVAEKNGEMQIAYDYATARRFADLGNPESMGANAANDALSKLSPGLPETGAMPIVLSPDAAEEFFSSVYEALNGDAVYEETTFWKDKIGQQVMSRGVTLVDDPTIEKGISSGQIDSSGMEMKKITFIEDGVLKAFNMTLMQARQLGASPIGRNDGATNGIVLPGTKTPEDLIKDIADGIYIKGFKGGATDVNTGAYSCPAEGFLIKNGKITAQAVDGFVVSGNLKEMFMRVSLANDTPKMPDTKHSLSAPTTRIDNVMIAGK